MTPNTNPFSADSAPVSSGSPPNTVLVDSAARFNVAFVNRSNTIADEQALPVVAALQKQVSEHFAPVWGVDARLSFYGVNDNPPDGLWWIVILDDTDQAGDLGYHDLTDQGLPLGKVFAKTDLTYNSQWTVTASHELLEMIVDPYINLAAIQYPGNNNTYMSLYAYEVCDACEADRYGYEIDGVLVSDFVFPSWFENSLPPFSRQFDYLDKIQQPLQLLPGGYISIYDVQHGAGWTQQAGPAAAHHYANRAQIGSRRERRRIPRSAWQCSRAQPGSGSSPSAGQSPSPSPSPSKPSPRSPLQTSAQPGAMQRLRTAAVIKQLGDQKRVVQGQVESQRAARYQAFLQNVEHPTEAPGFGLRSARPAAAGKRALRILAEGDSWFDYPLPPSYGVAFELENLLGYPIANMAHAGEEVRQMLGLSVRQEIIKRLTDAGNIRFDALLFSGGGDDLVGDALAILLQNGATVPPTPPQMLNDDAVAAAMAFLEAEFRELIRIRDRYSAGTAIFVNCYDFPPITGLGVCGQGPWLRPSLDYAYHQANISNPDPNAQFLIVRELLLRFRAMLVRIGNDPQVKGFYVVETQQTLDANNTDWANELHPTPAGFQKVARKFQAALQAIFP